MREESFTGILFNEFFDISINGFYQEDQPLIHQTFEELHLILDAPESSLDDMIIQYIESPTIGVLIEEIDRSLSHYKSVELLNRTITTELVQNLTRFLREDPGTNDVMVAFDKMFESNSFAQGLQKNIWDSIAQNLTFVDLYGYLMQ